MGLTREDLENDILRKTFEPLRHEVPLVPESEFQASLDRVLEHWDEAGDLWLFAYGSLIWNPLLHYVERRLAGIHGFHRCFCLRSRTGRGSPDNPGLVLGLDLGGCCRGMAFRITAPAVRHELRLVWRREMVLGSYAPRWVTARTAAGQIRALAFVINHGHPHYAGKLPLETIVHTLATARGRFGSAAEYLHQTVDSLAGNGIHDPHLTDLQARVMSVTRAIQPPVECRAVGA